MNAPATSHAGAAYFDALFAGSDDPWNFRTRWYEERKRAITLACLPARRYASAFEPGCANGELSAALAPRCDRLLISDGSAGALAVARRRVASFAHVEVRQGFVPGDWPAEPFDLVVLSELAYYLDTAQLDTLAERCCASLRTGGAVVVCHWRRQIAGCAMDGDAVHRRLQDRMVLPHLTTLVESDFRIDVWCRDVRSVAEQEGIV